MATAFEGLLTTTWAIDPEWLPRLAAIAQRNVDASALEGLARDWQKRGGVVAEAVPGRGVRPQGARTMSIIDGVAVLPITGPIFPRANLMTELSGATSLGIAGADLKLAVSSKDVASILLLIDSPGGSVSGLASFVDLVRSARARKPVKAYVSGVAASAGYWIATAASEISLERGALVGSIGVVSTASKQVEPDANGFFQVEVVSTNAPNKRPDVMAEEGKAEIRRTLDAVEKLFIADVARGRKVSEAQVRAEFGAGGVKVGADAVAAKMADRVQTLDWALRDLRPSANDRMSARLAALKAGA